MMAKTFVVLAALLPCAAAHAGWTNMMNTELCIEARCKPNRDTSGTTDMYSMSVTVSGAEPGKTVEIIWSRDFGREPWETSSQCKKVSGLKHTATARQSTGKSPKAKGSHTNGGEVNSRYTRARADPNGMARTRIFVEDCDTFAFQAMVMPGKATCRISKTTTANEGMVCDNTCNPGSRASGDRQGENDGPDNQFASSTKMFNSVWYDDGTYQNNRDVGEINDIGVRKGQQITYGSIFLLKDNTLRGTGYDGYGANVDRVKYENEDSPCADCYDGDYRHIDDDDKKNVRDFLCSGYGGCIGQHFDNTVFNWGDVGSYGSAVDAFDGPDGVSTRKGLESMPVKNFFTVYETVFAQMEDNRLIVTGAQTEWQSARTRKYATQGKFANATIHSPEMIAAMGPYDAGTATFACVKHVANPMRGYIAGVKCDGTLWMAGAFGSGSVGSGTDILVDPVLLTPGVEIKQVVPMHDMMFVLTHDGTLYSVTYAGTNNTMPAHGATLTGVSRLVVGNGMNDVVAKSPRDGIGGMSSAYAVLETGGISLFGDLDYIGNTTDTAPGYSSNNDALMDLNGADIKLVALTCCGVSVALWDGTVMAAGDPAMGGGVHPFAAGLIGGRTIVDMVANRFVTGVLLEDGDVVFLHQNGTGTFDGDMHVSRSHWQYDDAKHEFSGVRSIHPMEDGFIVQYTDGSIGNWGVGGKWQNEYADYQNNLESDYAVESKDKYGWETPDELANTDANGRFDGILMCVESHSYGSTMRFLTDPKAHKVAPGEDNFASRA